MKTKLLTRTQLQSFLHGLVEEYEEYPYEFEDHFANDLLQLLKPYLKEA